MTIKNQLKWPLYEICQLKKQFYLYITADDDSDFSYFSSNESLSSISDQEESEEKVFDEKIASEEALLLDAGMAEAPKRKRCRTRGGKTKNTVTRGGKNQTSTSTFFNFFFKIPLVAGVKFMFIWLVPDI